MQAQLVFQSWLNPKRELGIGNVNVTDFILSNRNSADQLNEIPADLFEVQHPSLFPYLCLKHPFAPFHSAVQQISNVMPALLYLSQ